MTGAKRVESFPVTVQISGTDYVSLSRLAEQAGHDSISDYVQAVVDRLAAVQNHRDRVETLNAEGLTNRDIAEKTGLTVGAIQTRLKVLGLHSNRMPRHP